MVFKWNIDIVLNKYLPPNQVHKFPQPLKRFLGGQNIKNRHDYLIWLEILISTFCGIALLEGVFKSPNIFSSHHHAPMIIASYGATAILCFNANQAPLSQPRNILMGHFISSLIGVCFEKLFLLSHYGRDNYWACGALSVAVSSVAMSLLNCVHPPAGALALLPAVDEQIRAMSWWYLPVQIISCLLIMCVALIFGNIIRVYPMYWWTPANLEKKSEETLMEIERTISRHSTTRSVNPMDEATSGEPSDLEKQIVFSPAVEEVVISPDSILVPKDLDLDEIEIDWLNTIQRKIRLRNGDV
ncbi:uncharacterized protein KQ657_000777 [Scheffersomyces spartinae]|uniref:HPP transmembrane region domain-containing protein n=1 Tax=Scheffersomyces spartinae TaxID=45513 RepID=A0A9P7V8G6_9ASCO|nr:uncharacterized protein KQ657_000777 [Scheffersomyces spartinae]KAG7193360.1 hypothetical protein KQ657_000777 [Scheffersomyces spartinae]